jgi:predicted ATPase
MIAHVTGGKALPKDIAEQIIDRTDGVPLFIEEPLLTSKKFKLCPKILGF